MIFKKYSHFLGDYRINENVQQAKSYLRNRDLETKKKHSKIKDPEEIKKISLTPEEVRRAENNPEFIKIKEMLNAAPGYVYAFTKFHFDFGVELTELKALYDKMKEYNSLLSQLPMTVDKYADIVSDTNDQRNGF